MSNILEPLILAYGTGAFIVGVFLGCFLTEYSLKELLKKRNVFGKITLFIILIVFSPGIIPFYILVKLGGFLFHLVIKINQLGLKK